MYHIYPLQKVWYTYDEACPWFVWRSNTLACMVAFELFYIVSIKDNLIVMPAFGEINFSAFQMVRNYLV